MTQKLNRIIEFFGELSSEQSCRRISWVAFGLVLVALGQSAFAGSNLGSNPGSGQASNLAPKTKRSSFSTAPVFTDAVIHEKVNRVISKVDQLIEAKGLDPLLGSQLKMAALIKPMAVASMVGDGFFSRCGEMPKQARNNYFRTLIEGAKYDAPLQIAEAVRDSLRVNTGITEKEAQQKSCKLASGPCYLYYNSGPVALNCVR